MDPRNVPQIVSYGNELLISRSADGFMTGQVLVLGKQNDCWESGDYASQCLRLVSYFRSKHRETHFRRFDYLYCCLEAASRPHQVLNIICRSREAAIRRDEMRSGSVRVDQ